MELVEELQAVADSLNQAFDDLKKKSEEGPRSMKDPIFFSMRMIAFLSRLIEQHGTHDYCHNCDAPAPCKTIKVLLDHASGKAFQD